MTGIKWKFAKPLKITAFEIITSRKKDKKVTISVVKLSKKM